MEARVPEGHHPSAERRLGVAPSALPERGGDEFGIGPASKVPSNSRSEQTATAPRTNSAIAEIASLLHGGEPSAEVAKRALGVSRTSLLRELPPRTTRNRRRLALSAKCATRLGFRCVSLPSHRRLMAAVMPRGCLKNGSARDVSPSLIQMSLIHSPCPSRRTAAKAGIGCCRIG